MDHEPGQWREARRRQRNRRVAVAVLTATLAASLFFFYEADKWRLQETSVIPAAVRVVEKPEPTKTPEERKLERIYKNSSRYPKDLLPALERNPEILDFAAAYLTSEPEVKGGISDKESRQKAPLFIQWDERWGYVPYGNSNIGISGCGPTCLSMVLYSITRDKSLTPDFMAKRAMEEGYYVDGEGTSWLFMSDICKDYEVKVSQFPYMSIEEIEKELDAEKLIICAMGPGDFTDAGHFIVIRGHYGNQLVINDPFSRRNSTKTWDYNRIASQIQKCWVYEK